MLSSQPVSHVGLLHIRVLLRNTADHVEVITLNMKGTIILPISATLNNAHRYIHVTLMVLYTYCFMEIRVELHT
jgi:hypothetical protein